VTGGEEVKHIAWIPRSDSIASFSTSNLTTRWDALTGKQIDANSRVTVGRMEWSPDGSLVAKASVDGRHTVVEILEAATGKSMQTFHTWLSKVAGMTWSPDGSRLVLWRSVSENEVGLEVWDINSRHVWRWSRSRSINSIAWSPDGRELAFAGGGEQSDGGTLLFAGWVYVLDASTGVVRLKVRHGDGRVYATSVAWSPNGTRLASGNKIGLLILWDAASGKEVTRNEVHRDQIASLDWSPDGLRLASAATDGRVKVVDGESAEELLTFSGCNSRVSEVEWNPSGRELAAACSDGVIRIWDASRGYEYVDSPDFQDRLAKLQKQRAVALLRSGQWEQAIELYQECLKESPGDYGIWQTVGWTYRRLGRSEDALACFSKAIEFMPSYGFAWTARADLYAESNQWGHAAHDFAKALELSAGEGKDHYRLALLQLMSDDANGYRNTCRSMTERFASTGELPIVEQLAWTYVLGPDASVKSNDLLESAQKLVNMALVEERWADAIVGAVLFRVGRHDDAVRWLDEFVHDPSPDNGYSPAYMWLFLSMAHQRLGHKTEARKWLNRAVDHIDEELREVAAVPWNRRVTFELLREEAEKLLQSAEAGSREASSTETAESLDEETMEWLQTALQRRQAHRLAAAGKMKEATDAILQVPQLQPEDSQLLRQLADEHLASERLSEAASLLALAAAQTPEEPAGWLELTDLCTRIGDSKYLREATEMAVSTLGVTGEEPPERPGGLLNSGMALAHRGHINEGCSLLKASAAGFGSLSRAHPENINYARSQAYSLLVWSDHCAEQTHRKEILTEAEEILFDLLEHIEESSLANSEVAKLYCSCGQLYTRQGLIEKGRSMLTKAVENDPHSAWFRSRLAMALLDADGSVEARPAEAVEHAVTAMELKSESSVIIDTCREATAALRAALEEENSQDLGSRYLVAIGLALLGQQLDARVYLEQAEQRFGQMQTDPDADLIELRQKALSLVNFDSERPTDNHNR
jgi:tetratricopeptide (TPR) repeat protein/Tol biopolymer transport system component